MKCISNKCSSKKLAKQALNWVTNELLGRMRGVGLTFAELSEGTHTAFGDALSPAEMAALVEAVQDRKISGKIGKAALDAVFGNECGDEEDKEAVAGESPMQVVARNGWMVISDSDEVHKLCQSVVNDPAYATQLEQFRSGEKPKLRGYFIGQVMKRSNGQADPQAVGKILNELL